ncbi:hypothetical protein HII13_003662 [Brettanomyces bruxellensis]|nr:hypothetical protein HII13_003662 [Brettanomyces bruxellensis]
MKVIIKLNNEQIFHVTVPDNSTVEDLKIASLVALPLKLAYQGIQQSFGIPSYGITSDSNSTVYLTAGSKPVVDVVDSEHLQSQLSSESAVSCISQGESDQEHTIRHTRKKSRSKSKSKGKNRCSFGTCHATALRLTGECQFCKGRFCSKHRLLEKHNCKGLKTCKDKCFERNALKLRKEQTVASKV